MKIDQVVKICRLRSSKNFVSKGADHMFNVFIYFEPVQSKYLKTGVMRT